MDIVGFGPFEAIVLLVIIAGLVWGVLFFIRRASRK